MLLRLRVQNFKSLRDVNIRFGPLTCFVGPNGAGKSNIFDAIQFLRALAEFDIQSAAQKIRSPVSGAFGSKELFFGSDASGPMVLEADMLVPRVVVDDFGRDAEPATTLLRYGLSLQYVEAPAPHLEILRESLIGIKASDARDAIGFPMSKDFEKAVLKPTRRVGPLISTNHEQGNVKLMLHQDGGSRGQPIPAGLSPRTVVGGTNAVEYPTVLAARREMASWQLLHLEPSIMRTPDQFGGPNRVTERGGHLAAALARLEQRENSPGSVLQQATNRLAELVPDVRSIALDRDEIRQQLSVRLQIGGSSASLGPRSLSDGTLRFLTLVTLWLDPESAGVLCMEEPENGIHPARVPAMVALLEAFAVNPTLPIDVENPLRQVITNTHSPDVVRQIDASEVLFVDTISAHELQQTSVSAIRGRWRKDMPSVPIERLIEFLGGAPLGAAAEELQGKLAFGSAR